MIDKWCQTWKKPLQYCRIFKLFVSLEKPKLSPKLLWLTIADVNKVPRFVHGWFFDECFSLFTSVNISPFNRNYSISAKTFASNPIIIFKFVSFELFFSDSLKCLSLSRGFCCWTPKRNVNSILLFHFSSPSETLWSTNTVTWKAINFEGFRVGFNSFFSLFSSPSLSHTIYELLDMWISFCAALSRAPVCVKGEGK